MTLSLVKTNDVQTFKDSSHMMNAELTLSDVHHQAKIKRLLSGIEHTYLPVTRGISRAQDTYGYNRITVKDIETGKRFSECGGGYDMLGSAFGQWLEHTHQELLLCFANDAYNVYDGRTFADNGHTGNKLYGMTLNIKNGIKSVSLDGGCGLDCMLCIAKHIGLELRPVKKYNRKGQSTGIIGWHVSTIEGV